MGDKKMPAWPEAGGFEFTEEGALRAALDYQRARAEAATARLRVLHTLVTDLVNGSHLLHDEVDDYRGCICHDVRKVLALIGKLPPDPTEGG